MRRSASTFTLPALDKVRTSKASESQFIRYFASNKYLASNAFAPVMPCSSSTVKIARIGP